MKSALSFFTVASLLGYAQAAGDRLPLYMYVDGGSTAAPEVVKDEFVKMAKNGVSTIIMAFYLTGGSWTDNVADMAARWATLTDDQRADIHDALKAEGTTLLVSAGGASEGGDWKKRDPIEYGHTFCGMAKKWNLDGVDFDLENAGRIDTTVIDWLHRSAVACKQVFPEAIITSAPQSPYFDTAFGAGSHGHAWGDILIDGHEDGSAHDHILIQYYNQGKYYQANSYDELFGTDKPYSIGTLIKTYPDVPTSTFVVGKTWRTSDGGDGNDWVDPVALRESGCRAWKELNWRGGFMYWQHHFGQTDESAYAQYKALTEPCDGGSSDDTTAKPTTTTTTKRTTTTTTTTKKVTKRTTTTTKPATTRTTTKRTTTAATSKKQTASKPKTTTPRLRTTTKAGKVTSTTTGPNSVLIDACKGSIEGVEAQNDEGCGNLCNWYGGAGAPQCGDVPSNTDELIACIIRNNSWCQKK